MKCFWKNIQMNKDEIGYFCILEYASVSGDLKRFFANCVVKDQRIKLYKEVENFKISRSKEY